MTLVDRSVDAAKTALSLRFSALGARLRAVTFRDSAAPVRAVSTLVSRRNLIGSGGHLQGHAIDAQFE
ncbi:hypothetical protein OG203_02025 [Nocardia sp. NBC_01499]|uniref:hypothetical protein n=1 Tax=Nocardia sp. NBC_01499 TaxID=2903597 RepID=UPI0038700BFC